MCGRHIWLTMEQLTISTILNDFYLSEKITTVNDFYSTSERMEQYGHEVGTRARIIVYEVHKCKCKLILTYKPSKMNHKPSVDSFNIEALSQPFDRINRIALGEMYLACSVCVK